MNINIPGIEFRNGLPIKIEGWANVVDKNRWIIIRADDYMVVEGNIVEADIRTGECSLQFSADDVEVIKFGPNGFIIIRR